MTEEWQALMQSLTNPRRAATGIHIFALANILRRVIIIMSDNQLSGLYLPLLWSPEDCYKSPLLIGYQGGFIPLMPDLPKGDEDIIPLVKGSLTPLVVRYLRDMELEHQDELVTKYLEIVELEVVSKSGKKENVQACKMNLCKIEKKLNMLERYRDAKKNKLIEAETFILRSRWGQLSIGSAPQDWHEFRQHSIYNYLISPEDDPEENETKTEEPVSLHIAVDEGPRAKDFFGRETAFVTSNQEKGPDGLSTALGKRSILKRQYSLSDMAPKLGLFGEKNEKTSYLRGYSDRMTRKRWIPGGRSVLIPVSEVAAIHEGRGMMEPPRPRVIFPVGGATGGKHGYTIDKSFLRAQRRKNSNVTSEN